MNFFLVERRPEPVEDRGPMLQPKTTTPKRQKSSWKNPLIVQPKEEEPPHLIQFPPQEFQPIDFSVVRRGLGNLEELTGRKIFKPNEYTLF